MEFIIGAVVIAALCLCLGVDISLISAAALVIVSAVLMLIFGFFIFCAVMLAGSERRNAQFSRIDKNPKRSFETAYYLIDGREYPNALPCEIVMRKRLYRSDTPCTVYFIEKKQCVFDMNAVVCTIVGLAFGGASAAAVIFFIVTVM